MLDTNTASYIIKGHPVAIRDHLSRVSMANLCVSAITEAELLLGLAKKPDAKRLSIIVKEFLIRVDILPWDSDAAKSYGQLRVACENMGKTLGTMDLLIAAHSLAAHSILVTSDKAFYQIEPLLRLEDWARQVND
jgi:tRNA(fMet)-specific endonuclease VapC